MSKDKNKELDLRWMKRALKLASQAAERGEVPVGAVVVDAEGHCISESSNQREALNNPLGHAEVLGIHRAAKRLGAWRLEGLTLYVTLEPCLMCAGTILQGRVSRVVFGARDPKAGAVRSLYSVLEDERLNHRVEVEEGLLAEESKALLQKFFSDLRRRKKVRGKPI